MAIQDDWDFNYSAKVLSHIDGDLDYNNGTAGQAAVGDYIYGQTSGAVGKVLAVTGTAASGTYTLTNVIGLFESGEELRLCSVVGFDTVVDKANNLQGFRIGDTVVDQTSGSIDVLAIEYNTSEMAGGQGGGTGRLYGNNFTAFTDNDSMDVSGGETGIASVHTAEGNADNDTVIDTADVNGTLALPGTGNKSVVLNYDTGVVQIPEQAIIEDATTGATALVERAFSSNVLTEGSVQLVDYNDASAWGDGNQLRLDQVIGYNNQVAGQVFSAGDVVVGATSGATGRVLLDTGTQLVLADESGTWTNTEDLEVGGTKIAEANGTNTTLNCALVNGAVLDDQIPTAVGGNSGQGGIYAFGDGLNVVRKSNSLYTLSQDTFDELLQLDDDEAIDATVKGGAYQVVFDWLIPVQSFRFLRQGAWTMNGVQDVFANPQTVGAQNKITSSGFAYSSSQPYRQPQLYIEQDQRKLPSWWLEGNVDVIVQVRTSDDTRYIDPATPGLGQLIPGGDPAVDGSYAVFNREYHVSTYDATQFDAAAGGVNTVALGTGDETVNNPNGTHSMIYTGGSAAALVVGETFRAGSGNSQKVGIVVSDTGGVAATGTLEYVLKSGTNFVNTDSCTADVSGKTFTSPTPTNVVAGYGTDISYQIVDLTATPSGGTGITGTFIPGEGVTQAVTGATGRLVLADAVSDLLYIEVETGTFSGDNDISGDTSGAAWDAGTGATYPSATTFNADLNNGDGAQPYAGSVSGDRTGANARTIQDVFQYGKYISRAEEETFEFEGPGTADDGTIGRFYRKMKDAYAEVKPGAPIGTYTGSLAFAQGWFLDTGYIAAADIRSFSVIDDNGVTRNPPNLQALTITGVGNGWRVAAYRTAVASSTVIQRTEFQVGAVAASRNAAADSIIRVAAQDRTVSPLPADVPDTGVLRVLDPNDTGNYLRFPYSSVDRANNDFTLASGTIGAVTGSADLTANDNCHVVFIEEQATGASVSNTIQYVADINIVYKARLKGFKPFRSTGTFGSTGASLGVVQTPDAIVDLP